MSALFAISRADGRSNQQVLLDYVKDGEPGRLYPYDELAPVLANGTRRTYGIEEIRQVIAAMNPRLLKEQARLLHNVRSQGYRLALAREHMSLAHARKRRADVQMKHGLQMLRGVRWDELSENERKAHEGMLMVTSALWENQRALEGRMRVVEEAIRGIT